MNSLYIGIFIASVILVGYLIGSIPTSVIVAKAHGIDITKVGSGNAGGTNVGRVIGKKAGIMTMAIDILKTYLICALVMVFIIYGPLDIDSKLRELLVGLAGFFVALGHSFPLFNHFKGGKAVACFAGYILFTSPLIALFGVTVFFMVYKFGRKVSLSSVIGVPSCFLISFVPMVLDLTILSNPSTFDGGMYFSSSFMLHLSFVTTIFVGLFALLVVIRHYSNIERLAQGKEPDTHFKKN
ncbi:MAG: glycerol-3-phosphate 1-O-acyltransferase PlsY [Bacilli bacterium]